MGKSLHREEQHDGDEYDQTTVRLNQALKKTKEIFEEKWIPQELFYAYSEAARNYGGEIELLSMKKEDPKLYGVYADDLDSVCSTIESWHITDDADKIAFFSHQLKKWFRIMNKQRKQIETHKDFMATRTKFFLVLFGELGTTRFKKEITIAHAQQSIMDVLHASKKES